MNDDMSFYIDGEGMSTEEQFWRETLSQMGLNHFSYETLAGDELGAKSKDIAKDTGTREILSYVPYKTPGYLETN